MVTWSKIDSSTFPELITEFLSLHPRFECSELLSYLNNQRSRSQSRHISQGTPEEEDEIGKHPRDGRREKISGDICPLEVTSVEAADEKGFCLALRDGAMAKYFLRNKNTEENEFSVTLNISKV